jgi:hypothetical protein
MRIAVAIAAVGALAASAAAATIRVPQDQPTIQAGVTAAATGDTVSVSKGTYFENVVVSTPGIRIVGKGVILDGNILGTDGDCLTVNAADVTVQGLTFRNGQTHIFVNATGLTVLKCTFQDANGDSINGTCSGGQVISSKFTGMSADGVDLTGDTNTVSKCTLSRSGSRGILLTGNGNRVVSSSFLGMDDSNAVLITGDGAFISKNKASFVDSDCFSVTGNGAVVELNKGDRNDSRLVLVNGNSAVVQKNAGSYCQGGISVNGDNAMILSNKLSNLGSTDGISVVGAAFTVTGNTVATTWDDGDGISADSNAGAGGGLIEGNKVSDTAGWGFNLDTILNVTVRNNSATRTGQDGRGGFNVIGDGNTLDQLKVLDAEGPGIYVEGAANVSTNLSVNKAMTDGIHVGGGAGNSFDRCSATGCGGEGFDNRGTLTVLKNSEFHKNRIDLVNDVNGGATFSAALPASVKFDTGDATTQPEVD